MLSFSYYAYLGHFTVFIKGKLGWMTWRKGDREGKMIE
jgi:hypothetical protein